LKIFFVIFALFTKFVNAEIIDINNRELSNLIEKKIKIIDVRTQNEWKSNGIIKGSFLRSLLNKNKKFIFEDWYKMFNNDFGRNKSIIFICASGVRSNYISHLVKKKDPDLIVYNLKKGINNWIRSGYKIKRLSN
jgi:rhodanese-related sulfurtransferase